MDNQNKSNVLSRRNFLKLGLLSGAYALSNTQANAALKQPAATAVQQPLQKYVAKKYTHLVGGALKGISDAQLNAHFGLYENYINKINEIEAKIKSFDPNNPNVLDFRGWHVEQTFNLNGAILHELYFGNLGGERKEPQGALKKMIDNSFGSVQNFVGHLKTVGKVMRGWSVAAYNYRTGTIHVYGLDSHNQLVPAMTHPILVLDVYEHAYMIDYGTDRKKYLDVFVANLDWKPVEERLEKALSIPFGEAVTV